MKLTDDARENPALVLVSPASLRKGGNITGEIWLEVAGFEFPDKRWSDFPVIILGWWLDALFGLWSERRGRAECLFMDGSYSFEVSKEGDAFVLRCFGDTHSAKRREWEGAINLAGLLRQTLDAAAAVIEECGGRGWATADTEALVSKWVNINGALNRRPASG
jgi:hypothetical protein